MRVDRQRRSWRSVVLVTCATTMVIGACGDEGESTDGSGAPTRSDAGRATATTLPCPGEPIRVTTIASLSGPLAFTSTARDYEEATEVALAAVNGSCSAGRPLEVVICDDKSDPNESTACGRDASEDGSIALFGSLGTSDNGANAAELPAVLTRASTAFDVLDPRAYPATSLLTQIMAGVSATAGSGAETQLFVAVDGPAIQSSVQLLTDLAAAFDVALDFLLFPPDTTDFSAVAAQIAERDPDAISLAVPAIVPFLNALAAEGITARDRFITAGVDVVSPDVMEELGDVADGIYMLSDVVPPQDEENPGIQQMLSEYDAAGVGTDPADMSIIATLMWSRIHILAETIGDLEPAARDTLDGQGLADALVARGRIERPELAPFDLSTHAFPDIEALSAYRIFDDEAMVVRAEGGTYVTVTGFADVREPFEIDLDG